MARAMFQPTPAGQRTIMSTAKDITSLLHLDSASRAEMMVVNNEADGVEFNTFEECTQYVVELYAMRLIRMLTDIPNVIVGGESACGVSEYRCWCDYDPNALSFCSDGSLDEKSKIVILETLHTIEVEHNLIFEDNPILLKERLEQWNEFSVEAIHNYLEAHTLPVVLKIISTTDLNDKQLVNKLRNLIRPVLKEQGVEDLAKEELRFLRHVFS